MMLYRLEDVEAKLAETEKEADKARKDSKAARDEFNDIKRRRFVWSQLLFMMI
jgi:structural maintenance of chromosome 1